MFLERSQYGFDRDSRRTWQKRPLTDTQDLYHDYDALSQVTGSARGSLNLNSTAISAIPAAAENWDYDPTGNWRGYQTSGATGAVTLDQHRVHDRGNRMTQIEDSPNAMILDRAGQMRQMSPDASGNWNEKLDLTWDAWGRTTSVWNNGTVVGSYQYDGLTRRITRGTSGTNIHSYYSDTWRPLEERTNAETTAAISNLWGARHRDDLVRRDRAVGGPTLNETRYVLMNYFNPAAITDESGGVTERYAFSAFGVRSILNPDYTGRPTSESSFEFAFQGQFLDTESGLYNYGYRYYSPYLGRWTCKDPIGEVGGFNLYACMDNGPVNLVDHLGLAVCCRDGSKPRKVRNGVECCADKIKVDDKTGEEYCEVAKVNPKKRGGGGDLDGGGGVALNGGGGAGGGGGDDDNGCDCFCRCMSDNSGTAALGLFGLSSLAGGSVPLKGLVGAGLAEGGKSGKTWTTVPSMLGTVVGGKTGALGSLASGLRTFGRWANPVARVAQAGALGWSIGSSISCGVICANDPRAY